MVARPFSHDELEMKQYFITLARDFHAKISSDESIEKELAAALLYMNLADYLAEYLVVGLNALAKEAVGKYYLGVLSVTAPQREKFNLESSIRSLQQFEFPQKSSVIVELNAIKTARNKIAHEMFKTKASQLVTIDQAERDLVEHTENLIQIVDEISAGLPPRNLYDRILTEPSYVQDEAIEQADEPIEYQKREKSGEKANQKSPQKSKHTGS